MSGLAHEGHLYPNASFIQHYTKSSHISSFLNSFRHPIFYLKTVLHDGNLHLLHFNLMEIYPIYIICHSVCTMWSHYSIVKPPCSNFRVCSCLYTTYITKDHMIMDFIFKFSMFLFAKLFFSSFGIVQHYSMCLEFFNRIVIDKILINHNHEMFSIFEF